MDIPSKSLSDRPLRQRSQAHRPSAFTLIELLTATAIGVIILTLLASSMTNTLSAWSRHERRADPLREARSAMLYLSQDTASYCPVPAASAELPSFVFVPTAGGNGSSRIAFLRHADDHSNPFSPGLAIDTDDAVLVAYGVGTQQDASGQFSQKLWRKTWTSEETHQKIVNHLIGSAPWVSEEEWTQIEAGAGGSMAVAYNVLRFRIAPLAAVETAVDGSPATSLNTPLTAWDPKESPAAFDVELRVINRATSSQLTAPEDWTSNGRFAALLEGRPPTLDMPEDDAEVATFNLRLHLP